MGGIYQDLPHYTMTVHHNCPPGGTMMYLYHYNDHAPIGWYIDNSLGASQYYAMCQTGSTNNDPTTTGACNDLWANSGSGIDTNIKVTNSSCPQWSCDIITTSFPNNHLCNTIFNQSMGVNQWRGWNSIHSQWVYFYFHPQDFAYVCRGSYTSECHIDNEGSYEYSYGWVDLNKGQSIDLQFEDNVNGPFSETINCLETSTGSAPSTATPTTSIPTTVTPTTVTPTTVSPTTLNPTTRYPITSYPSTQSPNTMKPTTVSPTSSPSMSISTFPPTDKMFSGTMKMELSTTRFEKQLMSKNDNDSLVLVAILSTIAAVILLIVVLVFIMKQKRTRGRQTNETNIEMNGAVNDNNMNDQDEPDFIDNELKKMSSEKVVQTPKGEAMKTCTKLIKLESLSNDENDKINNETNTNYVNDDDDDLYQQTDDNVTSEGLEGNTIGDDNEMITTDTTKA